MRHGRLRLSLQRIIPPHPEQRVEWAALPADHGGGIPKPLKCGNVAAVAKPQDPFRLVLWHASDRLFAHATDLSPHLDADPQGTLQKLSVDPSAFGEIRSALTPAFYQVALQRVLTAARAYIVNTRKPVAEAVQQGELDLGLTEQEDA